MLSRLPASSHQQLRLSLGYLLEKVGNCWSYHAPHQGFGALELRFVFGSHALQPRFVVRLLAKFALGY